MRFENAARMNQKTYKKEDKDMADIFIRISEPRAMQALEGYRKDAQTYLVEKAIVDYFERNSSLSIKDTLKAGGLAGTGRKNAGRGGNGKKPKPPKKERRPVREELPTHDQREIKSDGRGQAEIVQAARRVVDGMIEYI